MRTPSSPPSGSIPVGPLFQQALGLLQQAKPMEAEALCREIMAREPGFSGAYHIAGVICAQRGEHDEALRLIGEAILRNERFPFAYNDRGNVFFALKRYADAVADYDRAVALKPDLADVYCNRGAALYALNRFDEAVASHDRAIALQPGYAAAFNNRGDALKSLGRTAEALDSYDAALALSPAYAEAHYNRGAALSEFKRLDEALAAYDKAIAFKPDLAEAHNDRAAILQRLNRLDEAIAGYDQALKFNPKSANAFYSRGALLVSAARLAEAVEDFNKAIALNPHFAEAFHMRGIALYELARYDEAVASYEAATCLNPDFTEAFNNRGEALLFLAKPQAALACFEKALALDPHYARAANGRIVAADRLSAWHGREIRCDDFIRRAYDGEPVSPYVMLAVTDALEPQALAAKNYSKHYYPAQKAEARNAQIQESGRIRIAYASSDFFEHATPYLMAELFELHDRSRFEIYALSFGRSDNSAMRSRLESAFDRFLDIRGLTDEQIARLIAEHEIHIAVDLKGYTNDCRMGVFARRAAPLQISYLGYPGMTGTKYIDYIIADHHLIPKAAQRFYSEHIVYMPDCYQVNDTKRPIADMLPSRSEVGLPESGFVFCCFNQNYKITPTMFDIWMRLLCNVEDSVLWLYVNEASAAANLRREAEARGVAANRLVFARQIELSRHLSRIRLADMFLDTLPCNAHTTASDALWAGIPVLTCSGEAFASRVAGSLLKAIGMPELITQNLAEYEALALKLAGDPALLAEIKAKLARNRRAKPLFDSDRFRRHLEAAYATMWARQRDGLAPESFAVDPID